MCGIAGLWRLNGAQPGDGERLEKMAAAMIHRGPSDFGYLLANSQRGLSRAGREITSHFLPDVLLASRRLSITDLSPEGRQPIANETNDIFVVFNGAIHNYLELQAELKSRGHVFRTQTDTEVIVHAYEEWGEECACRFNGMWAYAIWDQKRERLVCSRDRFGIKPFIIAWQNNTFYFASEIKAILATGEIAPRANLTAVSEFITGRLPGHGFETVFEGIEQLQPAHTLVISRTERRETSYWSYTERSQEYDFDSPHHTFRALFDDALQLRLRAEVPVALLLSGGLDSSCIAVRARQVAGEGNFETFAFASPNFKEDESPYAEVVAKHSDLNFNVVEMDHTTVLDNLTAATWHMEEPIAQAQTVARWQLLKAASEKARIVIEGQGADEILAGYPERYRTAYLQSEKSGLSIRNFHRKAPRLADAYVRLGTLSERSFLRPLGLLPSHPRLWRELLTPEFARAHPPRPLASLPDGVRFPDALTDELYKDCSHMAFPYLLHLGDAISMAHSVESRLPFLDHRLVEFVFGLPFDEKIRGRHTKYILRQAFADQLPPQIKKRGKVGFSLPLREWLAPLLEKEIRPRLTSKRVRERGILNQAGLEKCFAHFQAGQKGSSAVLLRCLALEIWFEKFIDGR